MSTFHPWWPEGWVHPHLVFESLAYLVGGVLWRRQPEDVPVAIDARRWTAVAGIVGAAFGAKLLYLLEDPVQTWAHRADPAWLMGGKTIIGGLLGGWLAVELAKKALGVTARTGDRWVVPLAVGMAIGRIGCFFSGTADGTHGVAFAWGMDLGDGVPRHPTALYEAVVLALLAVALRGAGTIAIRFAAAGDRFRSFIAAYLLWRVAVEALKTQPAVLGPLTTLQLASLVGAWLAARGIQRAA